MRLETRAFVCATGNGLALSEDLARRFLVVDLDAETESSENRKFSGEPFLEMVAERKLEFLAAALTIWRWGRQNPVRPGLPVGSYETWAQWVRDPLIALGCIDPILKQAEMKRAASLRESTVRFLPEVGRRSTARRRSRPRP